MAKQYSPEQAKAAFVELVRRYGTKWTAITPPEAWRELELINAVLTEQDKREAFSGAR